MKAKQVRALQIDGMMPCVAVTESLQRILCKASMFPELKSAALASVMVNSECHETYAPSRMVVNVMPLIKQGRGSAWVVRTR